MINTIINFDYHIYCVFVIMINLKCYLIKYCSKLWVQNATSAYML